jgi:hypothetical protein
MSDPFTAAVLALIGFVITQGILKFVIEPIQEQRKLIGEVANALVVYANVSIDAVVKVHQFQGTDIPDSEKEKVLETQKALRELSGKLRSTLWSIPAYGVCAQLKIVTNPTDLREASDALISWSNDVVATNPSDIVGLQYIVSEKLGIRGKYKKLQQP